MKNNSSAWNLLQHLARLKLHRENRSENSGATARAMVENLEGRVFLSVTNPDLYSTSEDAVFNIPKTSGVLVNDPGNIAPLSAAAKKNPTAFGVISADTVSQLGAKVKVNGDGSFTFDPRSVASIQSLTLGQQVYDRFFYTVTGGEKQYVSVVVEGQPDGAEDSYTTTEDSILKIDKGHGVLRNDPGPKGKLSVVSFDPVTAKGVTVTLTADGDFTYDPTGVTDVQDLAAGDSEYDTFHYTSADSRGHLNSSTVTILVKGANDVPDAEHEVISTDQATPIAGPNSVLFNDSDPDEDDNLRVSAYDTISELGATIVMNPDGTYTYDPTTSDELKSLSRGEAIDDEFQYTITDTHGASATSYVRIDITGAEHATIAAADTYGTPAHENLFVGADKGVLANDTDADRTDVLRVTTSDVTSARGAFVEVYADGSFLYDPTHADQLQALSEAQVTADTFTYTVSDGNGSTTTQTVTVNVFGQAHDPDDVFQAIQGQVTNIGGEGVLANDPLSAPKVTSSPTVSTLGAKIAMNADGSFSYDPSTINPATLAAAIAASPLQGTAVDTFTYTSKDAAEANSVTGHVTILFAPAAAGAKVVSQALSAGLASPVPADAVAFMQNGVLVISTPSVQPGYVGVKIEIVDAGNGNRRVVSSDLEYAWSSYYNSEIFVERNGRDIGTFSIFSYQVKGVSYTGSGGDDWFLYGPWQDNAPVTLNGGNGNDLLVGANGPAVYNGGAGDDRVYGQNGNDVLNGGEGNDKLSAWFGNDIIDGGNGNDVLEGGAGNDSLIGGSGADEFVRDNNNNADVYVAPNRSENDKFDPNSLDLITGIKSQRQTDDDLNAAGSLVASIAPEGLVINGPSLYGFKLLGTWTSTPLFGGGEAFKATSTVQMTTAFGNIPLLASSTFPLTVNTSADAFTNVGAVSSIVLNNLLALKSGPTDPMSAFFKDKLGLDLGASGLQLNFGLKLGSELGSLSAPLNKSVPYFYFSGGLGSLLKFGESSVGGAGASMKFAFDPSDPFMWLDVAVSAGVSGNLSFGGSSKGYIPFTPNQTPGIFDNKNGSVLLKKPTATFSQPNYGIDETTDLIKYGDNGWAVYGGQKSAQTAVWQTIAPMTSDYSLSFYLRQDSGFAAHKLQKFRLSYTTVANPTASTPAGAWTLIDPNYVYTSNAASDLANAGGTITLTGSTNVPDTYEIVALGEFKNVTGFRLEALPGANGSLGSASSGNFILNEFDVRAESKPSSGPVPQLYGNIYLGGGISLGKIPVSVAGNLVLDLDANDDGIMVGLAPNDLNAMIKGQKNLGTVLANVFTDIRFGVNGSVNAEIGLGKSGLGLSLPIGSATAIFKNETFGFKGGTAQPFAGTLLSFIEVPSTTLEGYLTTDLDVGLKAQMTGAKLGGIETGTNALLEIDNNGAFFSAGMKLPIVNAQAGISGSIDKNGMFELKANAHFDLNGGPARLAGGTDFRLSNFNWSGGVKKAVGGVTFSAAAYLKASLDIGIGVAGLSVGANLVFTVSGSGFAIAGSGSVTGFFDPIDVIFTTDPWSFTLGVTFNNSGFSIITPSPLPNFGVAW